MPPPSLPRQRHAYQKKPFPQGLLAQLLADLYGIALGNKIETGIVFNQSTNMQSDNIIGAENERKKKVRISSKPLSQ
jgi:hypothetical protein